MNVVRAYHGIKTSLANASPEIGAARSVTPSKASPGAKKRSRVVEPTPPPPDDDPSSDYSSSSESPSHGDISPSFTTKPTSKQPFSTSSTLPYEVYVAVPYIKSTRRELRTLPSKKPKLDMVPSSKRSVNERPVLIATSMEEETQKLLKHLASSLCGSVVDRYSSSVTHIVTECGGDRVARRTIKYCYGVAEGKWVVSLEWAKRSAEAGCWLAEDEFEIKGDNTALGAPAAGRVRVAQGKNALFLGYTIYLFGEVIAPRTTEIKTLLLLGDAHVVVRFPNKLPKPEKDVVKIILCDVDYVQTLGSNEALDHCKKSKLKMVDYRWVLDSISHYKLLPLAGYVVKC